MKVKSFAAPLAIFHVMTELRGLDERVNQFLSENGIKKVLSVSDTCTTDDTGKTIGIIRVIAYED